MLDVAVIGAGLAGLFCAQQLTQAGYSVVVVEKSRGVGGRVATRRVHGTCADHGLRYLEPKSQLLQQLVQVLWERNLLQVWTDTYEQSPQQQLKPASKSPRYVVPAGMSAIAKFLSAGLEIRLNQRVKALDPTTSNCWHLILEPTKTDSNVEIQQELIARSVVVAIPAPQALMLLDLAEGELPTVFLDNLRSVEFDPCLSVIAGYPAFGLPVPDWKAITFIDDPDLGWIGLDSSKRMVVEQSSVFVVQSSAEFARRYLEVQDLHPFGQQLLNRVAQMCSLPWLDTPDWIQVHRWRYAFSSRPWHEAYLSTSIPLPLVCCGDWCGGAIQTAQRNSREIECNQVESAMFSGLAAAKQLNSQLQQRSLPEANYLDFLR